MLYMVYFDCQETTVKGKEMKKNSMCMILQLLFQLKLVPKFQS